MNAFSGYDQSHEKFMRRYYHSLPEDHRHRYAALEALKIGFGAIAYVAWVLGMNRGRILRRLTTTTSIPPPASQRRWEAHPTRRRRSSQDHPNANQIWRSAWNRFSKPTAPVSPTGEAVHWSDLEPMQLA